MLALVQRAAPPLLHRKAQLRALASNPDFFVDEGQLFELLAAAHCQARSASAGPP